MRGSIYLSGNIVLNIHNLINANTHPPIVSCFTINNKKKNNKLINYFFFFNFSFQSLLILVLVTLACSIEARRVRVRTRPVQPEPEPEQEQEADYIEEDNRPQQAIQYYTAEPRQNPQQSVVITDDDEYNGLYGQPTPARPRIDTYRSSPTKAPTQAPRTKEQGTKAPPVQTIRNYSKVNDDGSFTFGYEAADGSFKEETRGTDCVVRGKYGYVDPDGNKREFTYVSGNPCDPNNPDGTEEEPERSEEDASDENIPQNQNYPKQRPIPIRPVSSRPPIHTTTTPSRATTTVFQNNYAHASLPQDGEEEYDDEEQIQNLQPQRPKQSVRPLQQRPQRINVINTSPAPVSVYQPTSSVSITPRPTYRTPTHTLQTQPPATTYRPTYVQATPAPSAIYNRPAIQSTTPNSIHQSAKTRGPIDFAAEFQKFQQEHSVQPTQVPQQQQHHSSTSSKPYKSASQKIPSGQGVTTNPIYESQLVFDPATGQYDAALYQQLPQSIGDFSSNHRIQPYVHQQSTAHPQLVSLEQLAHQNPLYRQQQRPQIQQAPQQIQHQYNQQIYQEQQENVQVLNSQQLFAQQQELQKQQLQQDRLEAAKRQPQLQAHRFHLQQQQQQVQQKPEQQFYYIQPQQQHQSSGQIDAFLRGQNIEY